MAVETKLAVQLAVPVVPWISVHGFELKEPADKPVSLKLTVPTGVVGLPLVSVTVAVQFEG